jgi:sugar transferase (PEP-CTERM/EpsH1 system associated)
MNRTPCERTTSIAMRRPDILMLTHRTPYPPDKGDRIRTFHVLKWLSERAAVHLACLADEPFDDPTISALNRYCARVEAVPLERRSRWARALISLALGGTASEGAFDSPKLRSILSSWAEETRYHGAVASASSMVPYLRPFASRGVPTVVDLVDVDSQKWLDYAGSSRWPRSWIYRIEGGRLRRLECSLSEWTRGVTLVSEAEAELYRRLRPGNVCHAVTNGVDLDLFFHWPPADEVGCVFVGALDYRPNVEGLRWFCRQVWPGVVRREPGATLSLVGRNPTSEVLRLGDQPGVSVVGTVPDVRPHLARASVAVAPLRMARGVQNKVLEAMAMGKAVVVSPQALEGLRAEPGRHLLVASEPSQWIEAIVKLLGDRWLRGRLGAEGRRFVEEHHRWDRCLEPIGTLLALGTGDGSTGSAGRGPDAIEATVGLD